MIIDRVNLFDDVFLTRDGLVVTDGLGRETTDDDWSRLIAENRPAAAHWVALGYRLDIDLATIVDVPDDVVELAKQIQGQGVQR